MNLLINIMTRVLFKCTLYKKYTAVLEIKTKLNTKCKTLHFTTVTSCGLYNLYLLTYE